MFDSLNTDDHGITREHIPGERILEQVSDVIAKITSLTEFNNVSEMLLVAAKNKPELGNVPDLLAKRREALVQEDLEERMSLLGGALLNSILLHPDEETQRTFLKRDGMTSQEIDRVLPQMMEAVAKRREALLKGNTETE